MVEASCDEDGNKVPVRAKRNVRHLVTAWEDYPVFRTSLEKRRIRESYIWIPASKP